MQQALFQGGELAIVKVVSGGQTGADRGGLDAAIELGIAHGGWCPKGRKAEDGIVPVRYRLTEMRMAGYRARTERNVVDSDATVLFTQKGMTPGTKETLRLVKAVRKPWTHIQTFGRGVPLAEMYGRKLAKWLRDRPTIRVLNIAGSRESKAPGMQDEVKTILMEALTCLKT